MDLQIGPPVQESHQLIKERVQNLGICVCVFTAMKSPAFNNCGSLE